MSFVKNKIKFLIIPVVIILAGIVAYFINGGFNFDVEFQGGVRMQVAIGQNFENEEIKSLIKEKNGVDAVVQKAGTANDVVIKTPPVEEQVKTEIFNTLKEKYGLGDEALVQATSASASFGKETQGKAFMYTLLAILCILAYIAIRFEWRSAIMAVITLVINVLVMLSVYEIAYIPLNTTFIAAMLTVVGYSINNTIVIFDRIRENVKFGAGKKDYSISDTVDKSIHESMGRTINSTITTLVTIVLLYIIGVDAIKEFALPLIIGILAGAFSSITIAGPFWAAWKEAERKAKLEKIKSKNK